MVTGALICLKVSIGGVVVYSSTFGTKLYSHCAHEGACVSISARVADEAVLDLVRFGWTGISCRANMAQIRQSRPDSGLGFQIKVFKML